MAIQHLITWRFQKIIAVTLVYGEVLPDLSELMLTFVGKRLLLVLSARCKESETRGARCENTRFCMHGKRTQPYYKPIIQIVYSIMNTTTFIILAIVFGGSFLLMTLLMSFFSPKKKRVERHKQNNANKALLYIYGSSLIVNGREISSMEHIRGNDLEYVLPLAAGSHTIEGKYQLSSIHLGRSVNFSTPKPISCKVELEAGNRYSLGVSFHSPEEMEIVDETVYVQELEVTGGDCSEAYLVCCKEDTDF